MGNGNSNSDADLFYLYITDKSVARIHVRVIAAQSQVRAFLSFECLADVSIPKRIRMLFSLRPALMTR